MLENMGFLLCDSFMLTFVLSRSVKLDFFLLENTIHYDQFVNLNMFWFMSGGHHPFLYLLCMPVQEKTRPMFMPSRLRFAKKILMPQPTGLQL
jgi:hypothetical protein